MMDQAHQLRKIVSRLKAERETTLKSKNRIITVTSGKGGVGKTNFTVNFAISLSQNGFRVLIIDADFGLANVDVVMGIAVKYDLSHVLSRQKTIEEVIMEGPNGIRFISGGTGIRELIELKEEKIDRYIEQLSQLENMADIILVDTGAGINDNILKFILASNEVVLVTTPEPTAIMDAYALTKTVSNIDREVQIKLVVNMAQSVEEAENTMKNFKVVTETFLNMRVESLGYLLFDSAVSESVRLQKPFLTAFPKSKVAKNIHKIVATFVDQPPEKFYQNNLQKFLKRFFGKEE